MFGSNGANKRVICFIDDDPAETIRFEKSMADKFICVTGQSYEQCKEKLRRDRLKPDAWVLDLFFPSPGHTNNQAQLDEMAARYAQLERKAREFRAYLSSIGQGTEGGLSLLRRCKQDYRTPVIMFTRKGMLEDAIQCLDQGAVAVLKKPMPPVLDDNPANKSQQLDDAMASRADYLADHLMEAIRGNTFWAKHKAKVFFLAGAAVSALANKALAFLIM